MKDKTTLDADSNALLRQIARIEEISPSRPDSHLVGAVLGRFRIISLLGKGGMGVVYLAEDETLRRDAALKVLAPDVSSHPDRRRRLLREARAAAAVSHPNIAAVYDVGEADGLLFIAMEYLKGESLRLKMKQSRLSIDEALRIAREVLLGLAKAHDAGIVHRDLKPENVMVNEAGHVKLLDFGLAKFLEEDADEGQASTLLTEQGRVMGTPSYMSPEQAAGLNVDVRSDVFSFGVMLYEMVTGVLPFQGATFPKILAAIERDEPMPPRKRNAQVPPALEALILKCLKKAPTERFAHAGEVLEALKAKGAERRAARTWLWLGAAGAVLLLATGAGLAGGMNIGKAQTPAPAASSGISPALPAAGPVPTAITDLPLPKSSNPEALTAYREGLQAIRDGTWGNAYTAFKRSVELDSALGAGYLRLAYTGVYIGTPDEVRLAYRKAVSLRDTLPEHERQMLDILAPVIQQNPPDPAEARRRLLAAAEQSPGDVEWVAMQNLGLIFTHSSPVHGLDVAERCLKLDPRHADCLQGRAGALMRLGRVPEAFQAFEQCLAVSPASNDCLWDRIKLHRRMGECHAMEVDARLSIANDPNRALFFQTLATSLLAQGQQPAAVRHVIEQGWQRVPEKAKTTWGDLFEIRFAYLTGQFKEAEQRLEAWSKREALNPLDDVQRNIAISRILHHETLGRAKEAGQVAKAYVDERQAWTKPFVLNVWEDGALWFQKRLLNAGLMPRKAYLAERAAYVQRWEKILSKEMQGLVWLAAYATLAQTPGEAKEALSAMPELKPLEYYDLLSTGSHGAMGRVYSLAGRPAEAVAHLEKAVGDCGLLLKPLQDTMAWYHLGMAREALSNTQGACAAYQVVLDRWGNANVRVPAVEDVRRRAQALGCGK